MKLGKYLSAAAATMLVAAPVAAAPANTATKLSVGKSVRSGSATAKASKIGGTGGFFIAIVAALAVVAGVIIIGENDNPDSN